MKNKSSSSKAKSESSSNSTSTSGKIQTLRTNFTDKEWEWLMADENCRNVIEGGDLLASLFYCRFRLPRKIRKATFWQE